MISTTKLKPESGEGQVSGTAQAEAVPDLPDLRSEVGQAESLNDHATLPDLPDLPNLSYMDGRRIEDTQGARKELVGQVGRSGNSLGLHANRCPTSVEQVGQPARSGNSVLAAAASVPAEQPLSGRTADGRPIQDVPGYGELDRVVGYDNLDRAPLFTLPPYVQRAAQPTVAAMTTAIAKEGGRGPAAHRLLARTVVLARIELRHRQSLLNFTLDRYVAGHASERQVRMLEKLVAGAHRRLIEAVDCLNRLGAASVAVQVNAVRADVSVNGGSR